MRNFPATPIETIACIWRNRSLIHASAKREVLGRYRGSTMGLFWSFLNPLFMLTIYTFVFSEVFKARWGTVNESKAEFALILFAGLIIFNLFAECINRAPGLILGNPNYVKKVVFPLEILPFVNLCSATYHATLSLLVWFVAYIILIGTPHWTALMLPVVIIPFMFFIMGLSWILASLGVFLRDVSQFIGLITTALMFMSPIFYPMSSIPEKYRDFLLLNPLTQVIESARDVLYWNKLPDPILLLSYWLVAMLFAWLGFAWFQKTRKGFADVL
ncbi:ABC transporter permease [Aeromonas salmonicida]